MNIQVFDTDDLLAQTLATYIVTRLRLHPATILGLPTGRTPLTLYERLRDGDCNDLDWSAVRTFNLDEFVGFGGAMPGSYRDYMERALFAHVNIAGAHVGFLNGLATDLQAECERYERAITACGGIDLMLLGVGENGHIGFNEPSAGLHARSHVAVLEPGTRAANAALFGRDANQVPEAAVSMGMATILHSRSIVLIATGEEKAAAVRGMIEGPITTTLPASFLQLHPQVTVMLDRAARRR